MVSCYQITIFCMQCVYLIYILTIQKNKKVLEEVLESTWNFKYFVKVFESKYKYFSISVKVFESKYKYFENVLTSTSIRILQVLGPNSDINIIKVCDCT